MSKKEISVCMSVYGSFDILRLKTAILSIKKQEEINLEIIVSEEGPEPRFINQAKNLGVSYYYNINNPKENMGYNPGRIRNIALKKVNTEFVYLSDADVILRNSQFLSELIADSCGDVLIKPPMVRIDKKDALDFMNLVELKGMEYALKKLNYHNQYVASLNAEPVELKVVNHKGRIYTTDMESFIRYKSDASLKGLEPTFWFDVVHCGGIFAKTEQVQRVGMYCEKYLKWGYEDSDLQWKLSEMYKSRMIPDREEFRVLHIDHNKGYFSAEDYIANGKIFQCRKESGATASIKEDLNGLQF